MDLLFSRYASPYLLMDSMIGCNRFCEFIIEIYKMHNDRITNETLFDMWLHKDFENSYAEFRESVNSPIEAESQNIDFEATINDSRNILDGFNPLESE